MGGSAFRWAVTRKGFCFARNGLHSVQFNGNVEFLHQMVFRANAVWTCKGTLTRRANEHVTWPLHFSD